MRTDRNEAARRPEERPHIPQEVCRGAVLSVLFEGTATSEARVEALLDRIGEGRP
jgi:hypothetical protein